MVQQLAPQLLLLVAIYAYGQSVSSFFIKDVWGPKGSVTITAQNASSDDQSDNVDAHTKTEQIRTNITDAITNRQFEERVQDEKRNIYVLKPEYLNIIKDDMKGLMPYEKGSTEYINESLKRAENIRLYS